MHKALLHFVILASVFFGVWRILSQVDFTGHLNIAQFSKDNERKIGDFIVQTMRRENEGPDVNAAREFAEKIKVRICKANSIDDATIQLYVLSKDEVNAFALPGRHLIIYSGLIRRCRNPEEISGVIAHEIAHMERGHVTKKLVREVGLSMLMTMAGGDAPGEIGRQVLKVLSSTAFDRDQENEADSDAVHMMAKAGIDPEHLANFLFRLSQEQKGFISGFKWLNTHPNSQDRSSMILNLRNKEKYSVTPVAGEKEWEALLKTLEGVERQNKKPE
jgi:beta-barrel assembly-enhancing protease